MADGGVSRPGIPTGYRLWHVSKFLFYFFTVNKAYFLFLRMQAVQNLGMAVVTMLAGRIVDDQGYLVLEVFFLGWLCRTFRGFSPHLKTC